MTETNHGKPLLVQMSENDKGKSNIEVLYQVTNESVFVSPKDESIKLCKLPADFKLVFFGTVGTMAAL